MTRELLLAVAVLTVAAACTSSGTSPAPAPDAPPAATGPPPSPGTPTSRPTGITSQEAARVAPLAPAHLSARPDAHGVRLEWPATGEDVAYYRCLRRPAQTSQWTTIGRTVPTDLAYVDRDPVNGSYVYGVQAVNAYGVASATTQSQPVTVH